MTSWVMTLGKEIHVDYYTIVSAICIVNTIIFIMFFMWKHFFVDILS